jgi:hypothetical protein
MIIEHSAFEEAKMHFFVNDINDLHVNSPNSAKTLHVKCIYARLSLKGSCTLWMSESVTAVLSDRNSLLNVIIVWKQYFFYKLSGLEKNLPDVD